VPAPDVMTSSQHMLWMLDEFETIRGERLPGFITGKPVGMGGSLGRTEATGYGVVFTLREALKELGIRPRDTRASVQGFGNVSQYAIELYLQLGGTVTCISCWNQADQCSYAFRKEGGVDPVQLRGITDRFGDVDKHKAEELGYEVLPGDAWIDQEVEILIPAALESQIRLDNVERKMPRPRASSSPRVRTARPTPEAHAVLEKRGIVVIPDVLANAGGVTCSYFEQVQSNMNYYWDKEEVLGKLDLRMTQSFVEVSELARQEGIGLRDASYVIAVTRVADASQGRGWA
jgi:glutamate dehydrogenase